MAGSNNIYYWDTCVFVSWLADEQTRAPGEMDGVRDYVAKIQKHEIKLITSAITFTEISATKIPAGVYPMFEDLFKRRNVRPIAVDMRIAKLAKELRDYYLIRETEFNGKTLSTPDAIHLASAILYKAEEFHTFDRRNNNKSLGLLPLSGNVGGHKLTICKPETRQPGLDLGGTE